jgi:conjugal transfer/type IV secretion protein DotA/TraY
MIANGMRAGDVVKYALLPRILPRFTDLFFTGFHFFAFFMAQIYRGVRLLPANHPYLLPANIGRFGVRDVIAEAARQIVFRKENIDQIIVFVALLLGLVLLAVQGVLLLAAIFMPGAMAGPFDFGYYFGQNVNFTSDQDLAFILLDRVFGVPGIFNSCVDPALGIPCFGAAPDLSQGATTVYTPAVFPWPYHVALHTMFQFYSMGLLVVGLFIFLYFVVVLVAETAQTGTPFGKRFNSVWAPLRLVFAFGLLIPIGNGLNTAQYITLYVAKFGSNFASNGWYLFNSTLADTYINSDEMIAVPKRPNVDGLLQFMMLAHGCKALEEGFIAPAPTDGILNAPSCPGAVADGYSKYYDTKTIDAWLIKPALNIADGRKRLFGTSYNDALTFTGNSDIIIRFGELSCGGQMLAGNVLPTCGEISLPNSGLTEPGSLTIQEGYYELIKYLWGPYGDIVDPMAWGRRTDDPNGNGGSPEYCWEKNGPNYATNFHPNRGWSAFLAFPAADGDMELRRKAIAMVQAATGQACQDSKRKATDSLSPPDVSWLESAGKNYREGDRASYGGFPFPALIPPYPAYPGNAMTDFVIVENIFRAGVNDQQNAINGGAYAIPADHLARGWGGAGMWYNHIAKMNGAISGAAWEFPKPSRFPTIMESVLAEKRKNNENLTPEDQFSPNRGGGGTIQLPRGQIETTAAGALNEIYTFWGHANSDIHKPKAGNLITDFIQVLFGVEGLMNIRSEENLKVHPLAQLTAMGKSLVEASIRNIGLGAGGKVGEIFANAAGLTPGGTALGSISGFLFSIAGITLTAGFVLYYIIPFLPFLYFFFALGNWVKGIFEAMVGVPLWALAHIRIDGNGLPGDAAMNGYYMLFEIFLRPILIVFGLLAAVTIFAAMASTLNAIFDQVVMNLGGADFSNQGNANTPNWVEFVRGPVDQFFYTIMYAVIMYIMALSSFKLIDLIPNQIMRWMGSSVSTFSDMTEDPASNLTQVAAIAGSQVTQQAVGGFQSGMSALSEGAKSLAKK